MKKKSIFLGLALTSVTLVSLASCSLYKKHDNPTGTSTPTTPTTTDPITSVPTNDPVTSAPITVAPTSDPITSTPTTTDPVTSTPTSSDPITDQPTSSEPATGEATTTGSETGPVIEVLPDEEREEYEELGYIFITSVEEFLAFRDTATNENQKAMLLADIDLEGYELKDAAIQLYSGIFDGRGHAIKNAAIAPADNKTGLVFKSVSGGTVKNVRFVGCSVNGGNSQGIGLVTGLTGGSSKFYQLEFNACSVIGGNYGGLVTGEANEVKNTYGASAVIEVHEITVKNNSSVTCLQYGGLLVGDVEGTAALEFDNLDLKGSFKGSSGNGAFVAGRCRAGCSITINNAVIDAEQIESNEKNGILTGGGNQKITVNLSNIYIKNSAGATLAGNNKDDSLTLTVENCFYNAENAGEAATFVPGGAASGFTAVSTANATTSWLEETLGLDFEDYWTKEGPNDSLYRLQASSTNVKSADATLVKLSVSTGGATLRFHKGETFTTEGLVAFATYSDGVQLVATGFEATGADTETAGKQTITVSYTEEGKTATTTYDIMVAEQTGFSVNDEFLVATYLVGESLDTSRLLVYSVWSDGIYEKLDSKEYTLDSTAFDNTTAGEYTLTVTNAGFAAQEVQVTVVGSKPVVVDNYVYINVDPAATLNGATVNGIETFNNLTAAIDYLEACKYDDKVNKVIYVAPGTYEEKIDTALANLHLIGTGENCDATVITYKAVESTLNPLTNTAYALNTVDCATVHVNGVGFEAANISIRNDFDYIANSITNVESSPQGLALTINADGAVLHNVHLYGNQDTLYLKSGRAYFNECIIEGNVDFIFGQDTGIALFEDCNINAVYRGDTNNTGYVTAMRVSSSTAKPKFGYVFLNCDFTADPEVKDGSMSLGRPWGQYATVAMINCEFSAAYSKVAYDGSAKSRWYEMSGASPVNADFAEYGSQGDGAITEAVAGGRILTDEEADAYTLANILAIENGTAPKWTLNIDFAQKLTELAYEEAGAVATASIETGAEVNVTVAKQAELSLDLFVRPWNADNKELTVEVTDSTIVSYANGVITGVAAGDTTITVTQGSLSLTINVTVVDAEIWTVTFNTDGTEVAEQEVVDNNTIDATAITTTKDGYVFKGWYKDADFEEEFDVVNDVITADTVLYARFAAYADLALENFTMYLNGEEGDGINSFKAPEVEGEKNDINLQGKTEADPGKVYALNVWGAKLQSRYDAASPNADCQFNAGTYISFKVKAYATITVTYRGVADTSEATLTMGDETLASISGGAKVITGQATKDGVVVLSQGGEGSAYISKIEVTYPTYIKENTVLSKDADAEKANNYVLTNTLDFSTTPFELTGTLSAHSSGAVQFAQGTAISFGVKKNATVSIDVFDAGYGQFDVYVNKVLCTDLDATSGDYKFQVAADSLIEIKCKNVGTEETPAYNKSYLYGVEVTYPQVITENTILSNDATAGNNSYVLTNTLDFSTTPFELTGTLGAHGSGAVQFAQGTAITFYVKKNATVSINVFDAGYGQFDVYVNGELNTDLDATSGDYNFKVTDDSKIEIKCKNVGTEETPAYNQSYLYGISVEYIEEVPVIVYNETFDVTKLTAATDKEALTQTELGDFFTLVGAGDKRVSSGNVTSVEFKDAGLKFTVENTVTVTVVVSSTGGTNMSLVALYDTDGTAVAATSVARAEGDVIGVTANVYDVYGTSPKTTITYTLEAGTYTIKGVNTTSTGGTYSGTAVAGATSAVGRGARFFTVTVVNAE